MEKFVIKGAYCGGKTLPSLNQYIAELAKHPKAGGSLKKKYSAVIINAIRRDLKGYKATRPVMIRYRFYEPARGQKRDVGNILACADKFIADALRDTGTVIDDDPDHVLGISGDLYYTAGEPRIEVELVEFPDAGLYMAYREKVIGFEDSLINAPDR